MKKIFVVALALSSLSFAAQAEILTCRRVIEVEGAGDYVYQIAPKVATRVPTVSFNTETKEVKFTRQTLRGGISRGKDVYKLIPPNEEFDGNSLEFKTKKGIAVMNFAETARGRFAGSRTKYIIGEFYEVDLDSTSWSYLCPLKLKTEIE